MRPRGASEFTGVLGWPLEHTLSPAMHNAAFRRLGLDWIYLAWAVPPDALGAAIQGLRALGSRGANVTMPHKEAVMAHLDEVSGDARAIGAVNTIQQLGGALIGHNTDIDGFREFLAGDAGFDPEGKKALVLGAGGAARAVVRALVDMGASSISITARKEEQAERLIELAPGTGTTTSWSSASAEVSEADLVVNATPASDPLPDARFRAGQLAVDLVYQPPSTVFVDRARAGGADAWGGLGMLVHQAVAAFRIWTGQEPPVETMSAAALHALMPAARD